MYCREQRFTLATSTRSYSCNQVTPADMAEQVPQLDIRHMIAQHMSPEVHFPFTENFPEALQAGIAGSQCTGMHRCTVLPDLEYAPFPQNSTSKLTLAKNLLWPQSTLVLSTGEANLGAHNFSNQIGPSLVIGAEAQATRLLGQNLQCIQLPMETVST